MTLYEIITALQNEPSTNAKLAIMQQHKDNVLFKNYVEATLSPRINWFISKKTYPFHAASEGLPNVEFSQDHIDGCVYHLAQRTITGKMAINWLHDLLLPATNRCTQLIEWMILKDFRAKVGDSLVAKTWPDLDWSVPYMRCSLPKDVKLKDWPWEDGAISQCKADGMYCDLSSTEAVTRNGSTLPYNNLPEAFRAEMSKITRGVHLNGEFTVHRDGKLLERKEGNGILNSMLSGEPLPEDCTLQYSVWDYYQESEQIGAKTYAERWQRVQAFAENLTYIRPIESKFVSSLEEAYKHFQEFTARGLEGSILKHPEGFWKDGTSKHCVKMKIEAELDLVITGFFEGTGKASGMLGALRCQSECGNLVVDVGTGFTDVLRKKIWDNQEDWMYKVVTIKCNDLISREGSDTMSLFLPVFVDLRLDKNEADTLERVKSIVNSAKGLS